MLSLFEVVRSTYGVQSGILLASHAINLAKMALADLFLHREGLFEVALADTVVIHGRSQERRANGRGRHRA